ncbi:MAG: tetratricopeptide repeat protein [Alcanivoracaceae bacterium]|nr:tetratricopeptide repeat protein [Alcanivoracaceae bacterium]
MNKIIVFLLFLVFSVNADETDDETNKKAQIDLDNISTKGLDKNVAKVFKQTKFLIEKARKKADSDLEFSASKEWCLLLHNFDFLQQAKDCYYTIGMDAKKEAKWAYLYGKAALEQGNMDDVEKGFKQAIHRDNHYLPAHYYLIKTAMQEGDLHKAFAYKAQVPIELQLTAHMLKINGDLYFEVENYHVAIGYYQQTLVGVPNAKSINYKIAQAYHALGQREIAEKYLALSNEVGIKLLDPYYQEVKNTTVGEIPYLIKGKAALVHGDLPKAIKAYQKALEYNPESKSAKLNIAVAYYQDNQVEAARQLFKEIIISDPKQTLAIYNLATIAQAENDLQTSMMYFEKFRLINSTDELVNYNLAALYYQINSYEKVVDLVNNSSMQSHETIQVLKAKSLVQLQQYAQAIDLLQEINKHKADNREVLLILAKLLSQVPNLNLRNAQRSLNYAKQAVALKKDALSVWQLIMAQDESGHCEEIQASLEELALTLKVDSAQAYTRLSQQRGDELQCKKTVDDS